MYEKCKSKNDWVKLRSELEDKFDDPVIRENWKTDNEAYMWDPETVPLQTYYSNVLRLCDKYDTEIRTCQPARVKGYYNRFCNGLPEKYKDHVILSMGATKDKTIERAYDIAGAYHLNKKRKDRKKGAVDVAGAVGTDSSHSDRVSAHDRDLAELKVKLDQVSVKMQKMENGDKIRNREQTPYYGGKPSNMKPSNGYNSGSRPNSQNRSNSFNRSGSRPRDGYRSGSGNRSGSYSNPNSKFYVSYDSAKSKLGERGRSGRPDLNQSNAYKRYMDNFKVSGACENANETNIADLDSTVDQFNAVEEKDRVRRFQKFMSDKKRYKDNQGN